MGQDRLYTIPDKGMTLINEELEERALVPRIEKTLVHLIG